MSYPKESKQIPLTDVPALWVLKIEGAGDSISIASPSGSASASKRFKLDNLDEGSVFKALSSDSEEGEKHEINIAGDIILEAPKVVKRYDITELANSEATEGDADYLLPKDVTPGSSEATGLAEVTSIVQGADIDSESWTNFVKKLTDNNDAYFLICVPTGFTHFSRSQGEADGYAYMIGKLTSDIESKRPLTLTFSSVRNPNITDDDAWSTALTTIDFAATPAGEEPGGIKLKGSSTMLIPANLIAGDATPLQNGRFVIKPTSYS